MKIKSLKILFILVALSTILSCKKDENPKINSPCHLSGITSYSSGLGLLRIDSSMYYYNVQNELINITKNVNYNGNTYLVKLDYQKTGNIEFIHSTSTGNYITDDTAIIILNLDGNIQSYTKSSYSNGSYIFSFLQIEYNSDKQIKKMELMRSYSANVTPQSGETIIETDSLVYQNGNLEKIYSFYKKDTSKISSQISETTIYYSTIENKDGLYSNNFLYLDKLYWIFGNKTDYCYYNFIPIFGHLLGNGSKNLPTDIVKISPMDSYYGNNDIGLTYINQVDNKGYLTQQDIRGYYNHVIFNSKQLFYRTCN